MWLSHKAPQPQSTVQNKIKQTKPLTFHWRKKIHTNFYKHHGKCGDRDDRGE